MGRGSGQPARMRDVVGVDHPHDLDLTGQPAGGLVERPRLEARPVLQVDELESRTQLFAELLQRPPQRRVRSVVVHHLDHVVGIFEPGQRLQGRTDDVHRLAVGRDLERDHRWRAHWGRGGRGAPPAHDVQDLEGVGEAEEEPGGFEHQEQAGGEQETRPTVLDHREGAGVDDVAESGHDQHCEHQRGHRLPSPQRHPGGRPDHEPGNPEHLPGEGIAADQCRGQPARRQHQQRPRSPRRPGPCRNPSQQAHQGGERRSDREEGQDLEEHAWTFPSCTGAQPPRPIPSTS